MLHHKESAGEGAETAVTSHLWSVNALARELGLDRRTVAVRLQGIPPDGHLGRHPAWLLRTALAAISRRAEIAGARLDAEQEKAGLMRAQRVKTEFENRVLEGKFVSAAEVETAGAVMFTAIRDRIQGVASIAPLLVQAALQGGELAVKRKLAAALDEALEELGTTEVVSSLEAVP